MYHFIIENPILEVAMHLSDTYGAPVMPALMTYGYIWLAPGIQITCWPYRQVLFLFFTPFL